MKVSSPDQSSNDTIRVFVAIELSSEFKTAVAELIEGLRQSNNPALRLVRPEGVHLTLRFLGDIDASYKEPIVDAVSKSVRGHEPFHVELSGVGVFPNKRRPRVLWAGITGDISQLESLQHKVENSLETVGFKPENRGFNPHLTLARIRDRASTEERQHSVETLCSIPRADAASMRVNSISLMKSTLGPGGTIHERLSDMRFT